MTPEQLINSIKTHGLADVRAACGPAPQLMLKRGWNLTRWIARSVPGAVLFIQVDENSVVTGGDRVLVVNAPESARPLWEDVAKTGDAPIHLVLLG